MECRRLDLTLISATNLKDVRDFGRMKVYAKISISNDPQVWKTSVDYHGETNPTWNSTMHFYVPETAVQHGDATLFIKLYCERSFGDRYVGEVNLSVNKMFQYASSDVKTYNVERCDSEATSGQLKVCYEFGEKILLVRTTPAAVADDERRSSGGGEVVVTLLRLATMTLTGVDPGS